MHIMTKRILNDLINNEQSNQIKEQFIKFLAQCVKAFTFRGKLFTYSRKKIPLIQ